MFQISCSFVAVFLEVFLAHKLLGSKKCIEKDRPRSLYGLYCVSAVICFSVTVVNLMLLDNCLWKLVCLSVLIP